MMESPNWAATPPALPSAVRDTLCEPGSLTERLIATGHDFAVRVLYQGPGTADADEAALLGLPAGAPLTVRHVALTLDGVDVVAARSACAAGCAVWQPILDRGSRSLGYSLFSGDSPVERDPLHYASLDAAHPLFDLARTLSDTATAYPARRCRFTLHDEALMVSEAFLPALETFLR